MQKRKRLYNEAKSTGSQEAWSNYRKTRNEIIKEINEAHKVYQEKLFDCDTNSGHKNFWRYIFAGIILELPSGALSQVILMIRPRY